MTTHRFTDAYEPKPREDAVGNGDAERSEDQWTTLHNEELIVANGGQGVDPNLGPVIYKPEPGAKV